MFPYYMSSALPSIVSALLSRRFFRTVMAEYVGVVFFLFTSIGTAIASPSHTATAFGLAASVITFCVGPTSGGHLNPAVTWSLVIFRQYSALKGIVVVFVQFLGAATGTWLIKALYPKTIHGSLSRNTLNPEVSELQGFMLELLGTAILTFAVFAVAVDPKANEPAGRSPFMAPLAIGLTVYLLHTCLLPVSSCGINPARSFGPVLLTGQWSEFPLFLIAPLVGGPLGAALHYLPALLTDLVESDVANIRSASGNTTMKIATIDPSVPGG